MADYNPFIQSQYQTYLGRDADQAGLSWWSQQMQGGMTPTQVVSAFAAQPEAQNAFYNDWDVYRNQARQATAGINSLPYVYGNYNLPAQSGQSVESILYPSSAGSVLPQLKGLLNFGPDQSQPVAPVLSSVLPAAAAPAVPTVAEMEAERQKKRREQQMRMKQ